MVRIYYKLFYSSFAYSSLGWAWIFIIEGIMTVVLGVSSFFLLPDSMNASGRWLAEPRSQIPKPPKSKVSRYSPRGSAKERIS